MDWGWVQEQVVFFMVMSVALLCKVLVAVIATSSAFHTLSRMYNSNSNNFAYLYVPESVTYNDEGEKNLLDFFQLQKYFVSLSSF